MNSSSMRPVLRTLSRGFMLALWLLQKESLPMLPQAEHLVPPRTATWKKQGLTGEPWENCFRQRRLGTKTSTQSVLPQHKAPGEECETSEARRADRTWTHFPAEERVIPSDFLPASRGISRPSQSSGPLSSSSASLPVQGTHVLLSILLLLQGTAR